MPESLPPFRKGGAVFGWGILEGGKEPSGEVRSWRCCCCILFYN